MPRRHRCENVVATLAVMLAMGGIVHAASVPRNSVDTPQLKNRAVTTPKLAAGAVGTKKVADRSLTLADLGGADSADFETTTTAPIAIGAGLCGAQLADNLGEGVVGDMVVGTLTDLNGNDPFPLTSTAAFMPSIVLKTVPNTGIPNLVVCNTGDSTQTLPAGSVFHWRLIDLGTG